MIRRIISLILAISLMVAVIPDSAIIVTADEGQHNEHSDYESQLPVTNLEVDVYITADTTYDGIVNAVGGAKINVTSGRLIISSEAVINTDIILSGKAILEVNGSVNGTITVLSTDSPDAREDWDGKWTRPRNLQINGGAYVNRIICDNPKGFGGIDGTIDKITYTENYNGEIVTWDNANVGTVLFNANCDIYFGGRINTLYVNHGNAGMNNARVERLHIANDAGAWVNREARIKLLETDATGYLWSDGRIETLILENPDGSLSNSGNITNLIVRGGNVDNSGAIVNAFLKNCSWFNSYENQEHNTNSSYLVKNMLAVDSNLNLDRYDGADLSVGKKYGVLCFDGGTVNITNTVADSVFLIGSVGNFYLNNAVATNAYFDAEPLDNPDFLNLPNPESVFMANAQVSQKFFDSNYDFIEDLVGEPAGGITFDEWLDMFVTVKEIPAGEASPRTDSMQLSANDMVTISFKSNKTPGLITVLSPSGLPVYCAMSCDVPISGTFLAPEDGTYSVSVEEANYGHNYTLETIQPLVADLNTYCGDLNFNSDIDDFLLQNRAESISSFSLTFIDETDNTPLTDYFINGDKLLLTPNYSGHTIRINAVHSSINWGNYWGYAPSETRFTAGEDGSVDISCPVYGRFDGWGENFAGVRVYLYDNDGRYYTSAYTHEDGFWSDPMPDGRYAAVFIRDPGGNFRFKNFSDYLRFGLKENKDYKVVVFENKAGIQIRAKNMHVPNAPSLDLPYLKDEKTTFQAGKGSAVGGEMVDLTLLYEFEDPDAISNAYAEFTVSDNCTVLGNDQAVNGVLRLPLDPLNNILNITVASNESGTTILADAVLHFESDGDTHEVYVGATAVNIVNITLSVPSATGRDHVPASGYATPGETVTIFDGIYRVAEAVANQNGFWAVDVPLSSEYSKYHEIRAALSAGSTNEITTQTENVYKESFVPDVEYFNFSYYVHGHSDRITLNGSEWGKKQWSYDWWPGSIYTFEVKLSNSGAINRMWVSSNADDQHYRIEGFYDEASGKWIASGQFCDDSNYMPGDFAVEWELKEEAEIEAEINWLSNELGMLKDSLEDINIPEITPDILTNVALPEECKATILEMKSDPETLTDTYNIQVDFEGDGETVFDAEVVFHQEENKTISDYIDEGYSIDENGRMLAKLYFDEENNTAALKYVIIVDSSTVGNLTSGQAGKLNTDLVKAQFFSQSNNKIIRSLDEDINETLEMTISLGLETFDFITKKFVGLFYNLAKNAEFILALENKIKEINGLIDRTEQALERAKSMSYKCDKCMAHVNELISILGTNLAEMNNLRDEMLFFKNQMYKQACFATFSFILAPILVSMLEGFIAGAIAGSIPGAIIGAAAGATTVIATSFTLDAFISAVVDYALSGNKKEFTYRYNEIGSIYDKTNNEVERIGSLIENCKCATCECGCAATPTPTPTPTSTSPTKGPGGGGNGSSPGGGDRNPDPSGYVYEAVDSNRLAGVTAVIYYQDSSGNPVLWNAEEYNQINPQITDSEGRYGWSVPFGFWKVQYDLYGFEPAETEWLKVPPPRTDVNVALMSFRPARVKRISLCSDFAEVEFDKYIDIDTVSGLIAMNGSGKLVEAVNPEKSALSDGRTFATTFRALLDSTKAENGVSYNINVADTARCYANISNEPWSGKVECKSYPVEISAKPEKYLESGKEIEIPLSVATIGGYDLPKAKASISRGDLAEIIEISAVDDKGNAVVKLKTKKAGACDLSISIAGASATIPVVIARDSDTNLKNVLTAKPAKVATALSSIHIILAVLLLLGIFAIASNITMSVIRKRKARVSGK